MSSLKTKYINKIYSLKNKLKKITIICKLKIRNILVTIKKIAITISFLLKLDIY